MHAQVYDWEKKRGDGVPKVKWVPVSDDEVRAYLDKATAPVGLGHEGIQGRDLHHLGALQAAAAGAQKGMCRLPL